MTAPTSQPCLQPVGEAAVPSAGNICADDNRCQLRYCSFCDYRVCCLVNPCIRYEWETGTLPLEPMFSCSRSTENPAYGLSSVNWLEQSDSSDENITLLTKDNQMELPTNITNSTDTSDGVNNSSTQSGLPNYNNVGQTSQRCTEEVPSDRNTSSVNMCYINMQSKIHETNFTNKKETSSKVICSGEEQRLPHVTNELLQVSAKGSVGDAKSNAGRIWSVLRHKQLSGTSTDANINCDSRCDDCVKTKADISDKLCDNKLYKHEALFNLQHADAKTNIKLKCGVQDKPFHLSTLKPGIRAIEEVEQPDFLHSSLLQKAKTEHIRFKKMPIDTKDTYSFNNSKVHHISKKATENVKSSSGDYCNNRLPQMTKVKTEDSIQEWLMRISEWVDNNSWIKDSCDEQDETDEISADVPRRQFNKQYKTGNASKNADRNYSKKDQTSYNKRDKLYVTEETEHCNVQDQKHKNILSDQSENTAVMNEAKCESLKNHDNSSKNSQVNVYEALHNASKESPANIPMVVMQCSRLHSHISNTPPFQQTSLPMGTLVTALYQESDWLYVQTPHGVEGFVCSSNCSPIGTVNDHSQSSKRPWEPCEFPIQISIRSSCDFRRHQGSFVPAKLPTNNGRQIGPYVNTVKMKTNFYNDRYFNNTFKPKDSIKTAKTVTDILRSSPETKITNQYTDNKRDEINEDYKEF